MLGPFLFKNLFQHKPVINVQGIYCFSPEDTGDYFGDEDVESWQMFYTIENEYRNLPAILDLFKKIEQEPWYDANFGELNS